LLRLSPVGEEDLVVKFLLGLGVTCCEHVDPGGGLVLLTKSEHRKPALARGRAGDSSQRNIAVPL